MGDDKRVKDADAEFARRLQKRDFDVLADIDRAYGPHLRKLLRRSRGSLLNDADIDAILGKALEETGRNYRADRGATVFAFYFRVGGDRLRDHLRKTLRAQEAFDAVRPILAAGGTAPDASPMEQAAIREAWRCHQKILALIDQSVNTSLTDRERRAFIRRSSAGDGEHWAKALEAETGVDARKWRKTSDSAFRKIREHLAAAGVYYSEEGGHYDIAARA